MTTDPRTVMLGVPTRGHPGVYTVRAVEALRDRYPGLPPIAWVSSHHSVCDTRNKLVKEFLASSCEYLLSLDDDCIPHADIMGMVDHHVDVVASPMLINRPNDAPVPFFNIFILDPAIDAHRVIPHPFAQTGLVTRPDLSVGSGCISIRRRVLEAIRPAFEHRWTADGTIQETEDLNFCRKARAAGFHIYADYDRPSDQVIPVAIHQLQDRFALAHQTIREQEQAEEASQIWMPRSA